MIIRFAGDIEIPDDYANADKLVEALYEKRNEWVEFAAHVALADTEFTDAKIQGVGGNTHHHRDPDMYGSCDDCRRYANRTELARYR